MANLTSIIAFSVLPMLISIVGIVGNSLTIFALYYAKRKRRYNFHHNWCTSTIYIINLSVIDLLICVMILISWFSAFNVMTFDDGRIVFNDTSIWWCTFTVHFQTFLGALDVSAIALISLTRAMTIANNQRWETLCARKRNVFMFLLSQWFLTLGLYAPTFQQTFKRSREEMGFCYPVNENSTFGYAKHTHIRYAIYGVAAVMIILSYLYILCYVSRVSKRNTFVLTTKNAQIRNRRNIQIAKTMAIVAFSSIFLFLPWFLVQILRTLKIMDQETYTLAARITYQIFILPYCINMFIYVWKKNDYRRAIMDAISVIIPKYLQNKRNRTTQSRRIDISQQRT